MPANWTEHDININDIAIHYTRTGGDKPPLVLLHGFSDNGMCWLRTARELEEDYDLILPDARGHGRSARLHPGEMVDMAADLAGLIQALGLRQPVVGGHSMGANVAALTGFRHPDLISALILEDPGWGDREERKEEPAEPQPDPFAEWLLHLEGWSLEQIKAKCRKDSPTWDEEELPAWAESKQRLDKTIFQTENAADHDWRKITAGLRCPALLLTADVDKGAIVTPAVAAEIARLNPLVQTIHISGAGHNIRREQFGVFMQTARGFLNALSS